MTHECPGPECAEQVDAAQLMCSGHWYLVPKPIRRAVWIAWNRGAGAGSPRPRGGHAGGDRGGEPCRLTRPLLFHPGPLRAF